MKLVLGSVLAAATLVATAATAPADAAPTTHHHAAHHYKNCTDMHRTYKGGVGRKGAHDKRPGGGHARYKVHVSTALYNANKKMDRDKDGIACEQ